MQHYSRQKGVHQREQCLPYSTSYIEHNKDISVSVTGQFIERLREFCQTLEHLLSTTGTANLHF